MNKQQLTKLDLSLSTIHLLNAAAEGMDTLGHKPFARQLRIMVLGLSKQLDHILKEAPQP